MLKERDRLRIHKGNSCSVNVSFDCDEKEKGECDRTHPPLLSDIYEDRALVLVRTGDQHLPEWLLLYRLILRRHRRQ